MKSFITAVVVTVLCCAVYGLYGLRSDYTKALNESEPVFVITGAEFDARTLSDFSRIYDVTYMVGRHKYRERFYISTGWVPEVGGRAKKQYYWGQTYIVPVDDEE